MAAQPSLHADDPTRCVQEELRKRNLFFGDVDGRRTPPFVAALRHYQERKGFSPSGEPDEQTLRSLDLPPALLAATFSPPPAAATISNPNPGQTADPATAPPDTGAPYWPDTLVLRSDQAPRSTPNPSTAALAFNRITPTGGDPIYPPAHFNTLPQPSFAPGQAPSAAEVKDFIARYLQAGQTNDPTAELAFYGEQVNYFNQGTVGRPFIEGDIRRYDKRWPRRNFTLVGPVNVVADANNLDHTVVRFRYRFVNRSQKATASGQMESIYKLSGRTAGDLRIIQLREHSVR